MLDRITRPRHGTVTRRLAAFHQGRRAFPVHHLSPSIFTCIHQTLVRYVYFTKAGGRARHDPQLSSPRHKLHFVQAHRPRRKSSPVLNAGVEDARVPCQLAEATAVSRWKLPSAGRAVSPARRWATLASHPAADAQPAVLSLSAQEESQTDGNNEMSASSTMLNKCHTLFLV